MPSLVQNVCFFVVAGYCGFHEGTILLHYLITQVFLRSLQYGIVLMGFIDAFVNAHHQHRRSIENRGNFGDHMKGRIHSMTAIQGRRRSRPTKLKFAFIPHCTRMCHLVESAGLISSTSQFTSSLSSSSISLITFYSCCPTPSTSTMWWTNTLRTSAEDLGTLAENASRKL